MPKAHLLFTSHRNSFSVKVVNLESLSVVQIQELEHFVSKRNGLFDFYKYTFSIQKKLAYHEFVDLVNMLGIEANCEENIIIKKAQARISFGQYKGMQYNELTDSYMLWLKSNYRGREREEIDKELKKRKL